jgi:uncharacterized protein YabE (DUF348 family)
LAVGALLALATLLALRPPRTVRVRVDGATHRLRTQAGTVAAVLAELGVDHGPHDRVQPAPGALLAEGALVTVDHARRVRLALEGRELELRSLGRTPRAILTGAGVSLAAGDRVLVQGRDWEPDRPLSRHRRVVQLAGGPGRAVPVPDEVAAPDAAEPPPTPSGPDEDEWQLTLLRALPVTLVEDGIAYVTRLAGTHVGDALAVAGMALAEGDEVEPGPGAPLVADMVIRLRRGVPFTLTVDGQAREVRANAATLGEAMPKLGLQVGEEDYTLPGPETPLTPGLAVELIRVRTTVETVEEEIPFAREDQDDPETELNQVIVVQAGQPGRKRVTRRVRYENGEAVDTTVLEEERLSEPVSEVVKHGTKVVWQTVETPEGPKQYWRKLRVYATSYSLSRSGTPKTAPWYGRTRSGLPMRKGVVAIDTGVIPMNTKLYVPEYGLGEAGDTGGGVKGFHIDLGYDDDNYQSWHSYVDVYLLEPLPPAYRLRNLRRQ